MSRARLSFNQPWSKSSPREFDPARRQWPPLLSGHQRGGELSPSAQTHGFRPKCLSPFSTSAIPLLLDAKSGRPHLSFDIQGLELSEREGVRQHLSPVLRAF